MPYRLDTLFTSLKTAFGVGRETLGRVIVKKLYAKVDVPLDHTPSTPLIEYVEELKQFLAEDLMQKEENPNDKTDKDWKFRVLLVNTKKRFRHVNRNQTFIA